MIRKGLFILLLLHVGGNVIAQKFWIKAGINFNQLTAVSKVPGYTFYPTQGFYAAALGEIPLSEKLCLLTGLGISQEGYTFEASSANFKTSGETNFFFLEIPLHLQYKIPLVDELELFAGAGPYVAWDPIWSLWRGETFGDYGLSATLGLEYRWAQVGASFDQGLARIRVSAEETMRTQVFSLRLGIRL